MTTKIQRSQWPNINYQLTGLDIPIDDLQGWVTGASTTKADHFKLNVSNTLASLDKDFWSTNWHVDYTRYKEFSWQNGNIPLPDRDTAPTQQQTSIKLVI